MAGPRRGRRNCPAALKKSVQARSSAFQPKKSSSDSGSAIHEAGGLSPVCKEEVEEAAARYESQRAGLGQEFRSEFEVALGRVVQNPLLYGVEIGEFRACPLKRFPYTIFYLDLEDQLWVGAVAHQSRRPGYWARRRPD
jgi:toxin ParE1/3/4